MVVNNLAEVTGRYDLIYADPPWQQGSGGKKSVRKNSSGKPLIYPTMSLDDIKEHLRLAPEIAYEIIERLYPDLKKLEMYARNTREGWDSFGNEL